MKMSQKFTKSTLAKFNGKDDPKIYIALKGEVFDVTEGRGFYGPGSSYNVIAGRDASVALGKMDLEPSTFEALTVDQLNPPELKTLESWYAKFKSKYKVVGTFSK